MKRVKLARILSLLLVAVGLGLANTAPSQAQTSVQAAAKPAAAPSVSGAKLVYLSHLYMMNRLYLDANRDFLRTLRTCLQVKVHQKDEVLSDPNAVTVLQQFISLSGEVTTVEEVCGQFVDRWLKTLVREHRALRKSMILRESTARADNLLHSHTVDADPRYKLNLRPRHGQLIAISDSLVFAELQDATPAEQKIYSAEIDRHTVEQCLEFSKVRDLKIRFPGIEVCDYLTSRSWSNQPRAEFDVEADLKILRKDFLVGLFYAREQWRKDHQQDYVDVTNLNPILLYLGSTHPAWSELIAAVDSTLQNHENFVLRSGLESVWHRQLAFNISDLKKIDDLEVQKNVRALESLLKNQRFDKGLSAYLRRAEPSYDFMQVITETQTAWDAERSRTEMAMVALAIGANVGCFFPPGKLIKFVSRVVLRTTCLLAVGLGFNTFFLLETRAELESELERLLMSTTARYARGHTGNVEEKRNAFLAAAILWPVGLFP